MLIGNINPMADRIDRMCESGLQHTGQYTDIIQFSLSPWFELYDGRVDKE